MSFEARSRSGRLVAAWKARVKVVVGRLAIRFFPARVKELEANLHRYRGTLGEKFLKAGLFGDAFIKRDHARLVDYHRRHWLSPHVRGYYEESGSRFRGHFLRHHGNLIDALECLLREWPGSCRRFVEIGCGAGLVTFYMASRFPHWKEYIGLDLNDARTLGNNRRNNDPRIRFVTADALPWIRTEGRPHTVFLTNGGVLEYFCREDLVALVDHIAARLKPSLFLCIEPLAADHDLERNDRSRPHGAEMTLSHNYPRIFSQAGYTIEFQAEQFIDGVRWLLLLARCG